MAELLLGHLTDRLDDDEVTELADALEHREAGRLPKEEGEPTTIARHLDDDVLDEFLDRLDGEDIACEIYLPLEFDGRFDAAEVRVGSAATLLTALEDLRDDLGIGGDDDDEDEGDDDEDLSPVEIMEEQLREMWRQFQDGAQKCVDSGLIFFVVRD